MLSRQSLSKLAEQLKVEQMLTFFLNNPDEEDMLRTFEIISRNPRLEYFTEFLDKLTDEDLDEASIGFSQVTAFFHALAIFCVDNFEYDVFKHLCQNTQIFKIEYNYYHEPLLYAYSKNCMEIVEMIIQNFNLFRNFLHPIIQECILNERLSRLTILLQKSSATELYTFEIFAKHNNKKLSQQIISTFQKADYLDEIVDRAYELAREEFERGLRQYLLTTGSDLNPDEMSVQDKKHVYKIVVLYCKII